MVARLFGVPIAAANMAPICEGPMGRQDLRIPKLLVANSPPAVLSFDQMLGSDRFRHLLNNDHITKAGVEYIDNTAEEICELAIEMLDRLEGVIKYESMDDDLQRRFRKLVVKRSTPMTFGTRSRIGRHFLRLHADLFEGK